MNTPIQPPPPEARQGLGCFGKGCLILCLLVLFLLIAGAIGMYVGMKRYPGLVKSAVFVSQARVLAAEASPIPEFQTTEGDITAAKQKWKAFEKAPSSAGKTTTTRSSSSSSSTTETTTTDEAPTQIELTAADLNNLIAGNKNARGKAFVSIAGNTLTVQASVPLGEYVGRDGYFLNGNVSVETNGPQSPDNPDLSALKINGRPVPAGAMDWNFKGRSVRDYSGRYAGGYKTIEIRDGRLILTK